MIVEGVIFQNIKFIFKFGWGRIRILIYLQYSWELKTSEKRFHWLCELKIVDFFPVLSLRSILKVWTSGCSLKGNTFHTWESSLRLLRLAAIIFIDLRIFKWRINFLPKLVRMHEQCLLLLFLFCFWNIVYFLFLKALHLLMDFLMLCSMVFKLEGTFTQDAFKRSNIQLANIIRQSKYMFF